MSYTVYHGDCLHVMPTLDAVSMDAIVCDPPYGLSFMGKNWDHGVPGEAFWREALRVAKPGAHLLAFGGTRTYHRLACAIEDAGWEVRDCIAWVYGSGFPKSHNLKGEWQGWGTALKPAYEPIIIARKPLVGTVAQNVLTHGTGAMNVDRCRVGIEPSDLRQMQGRSGKRTAPHLLQGMPATSWEPTSTGRWPANFIHDGSEEVVGLFPESKDGVAVQRNRDGGVHNVIYGQYRKPPACDAGYGTSGSAARFFYCAKASKADRDEGCEGLEDRQAQVGDQDEQSGRDSTNPKNQYGSGSRARVEAGLPATLPRKNHHPTVKPTALMRYLCRLVTPPGGTVLDPFAGSGSTGKAAVLEGFRFVGVEREAEYVEIAKARIAAAAAESPLFVEAVE